jgi:hypothetical protein
MRNLFEVDSNEIKRILSLHEESTKKQYLNVLSEQMTLNQPVVLTNQTTPGVNDITLPKDTAFKKSTIKDILITDKIQYKMFAIPAAVEYNCVTGKFKVQGANELYNSENLETKYLKPYCEKVKQTNAATLTPEQQLQKAKKCGFKDWDSYKKSGWKCTPNKTFAAQNTELTKQIQTLLGNTAPTGQITDTDLDQLITQLNK